MSERSFLLKIRCENAAFSDDPALEVARLLREIARRVEDGARMGGVRDINGNSVGHFGMTGLTEKTS